MALERGLEPPRVSPLGQWDAKNASHPFEKAVEEYLNSRSDLRLATLSSYRYTLEGVFLHLHSRTLSEVTREDLGEPIMSKGATARRMHLANLRAFWRWAAKVPRNWCRVEILEGLEAPRRSNDADITILSIDDVRALLSAAEAESHAATAAFAIAVFGGVRMGELEKLNWKNVKDDSIEIGVSIAKKHARRLVPLDPTLGAWLSAHRNGADDDALIVSSNWPEVFKAVRRRAGWDVAARMLKAPPSPRVASGTAMDAAIPVPPSKSPSVRHWMHLHSNSDIAVDTIFFGNTMFPG